MKNKVIAFDLDDVLCVRTGDEEDTIKKYNTCKPIQNMIDVCNTCHNAGYRIVIYTARGMTTQKGDPHKVYSRLFKLTTDQLDSWDVKYHQLVMGKIHYDLLIDDKAVNSADVAHLSDIHTFFRDGDEF